MGFTARSGACLLGGAAMFATTAISAIAAPTGDVKIGYIRWTEFPVTLSLLEAHEPDEGTAGADLGVADNNTTGKFMKQNFSVETISVKTTDEATAAYDKLSGEGIKFVVATLPADTLKAVQVKATQPDQMIFNALSTDDTLRGEACNAHVVHVAPSKAMLADAVGQYLVWKRWTKWYLVRGNRPDDIALANDYKRAAKRFGAKIVEEREFAGDNTSRRTDSGSAQYQTQMPVFLQNAPEHDVVVVADDSDLFGLLIPYRTWDPRPVAGSGGLRPLSWSPSHDQWGAYQLNNRFRALVKRPMSAIDFNVWIATRMVGEAATRSRSVEATDMIAYIKGPKFEIAGFKGQKMTLRDWDLQLRQPVLLGDAYNIVSVSPQEGFLHEFNQLDTLGVDRPETKCKF